MEIIARRQFDPLYIWLDIAFLVLFAALLIWKKKYMTVLVGIAFGFIYFAVDYGLFHLVSRKIDHRRQSVLGVAMDVNELWLHEFCLDMALDLQG